MDKVICYIFGCGPTINDITDEEWKYLETQHTMAFSGFPFSGKKTKYYYSHEKHHIDKEMLDIMAKNGYQDTKLLFHIVPSIRYAFKLGFKYIIKIQKGSAHFLPSRKPWFTDEVNPPHKFKECRANNFNQIIFRVRGQLSGAINAALILGATEIRLIGVDLNCQRNFFVKEYQGEPDPKWIHDDFTIDIYNRLNEGSKKNFNIEELKKTHKDFMDAYKPKTEHSTNITYPREEYEGRSIRGISDILQWMDKELREEGLSGIYITSKKSLLYTENKLQYKPIIGD